MNDIKNNVATDGSSKHKNKSKPNYIIKKYGFFLTVKVTINNTTGRDNLQGYKVKKKDLDK